MNGEEYKALKEQLDRIEANQLQLMKRLSLRGDRLARMGYPAAHDPQDTFFVSAGSNLPALNAPKPAIPITRPGRSIGG